MTHPIQRLVTRGSRFTRSRAGLLALLLVAFVLMIASATGFSLSAMESQRLQLVEEVGRSASALDEEIATSAEARGKLDDARASAEVLAAQLSIVLELPSERFSQAGRTAVEHALSRLADIDPAEPESNVRVVRIDSDASAETLISTASSVKDTRARLQRESRALIGLRSELRDATGAARTAARTLIDEVSATTAGILGANAAASPESIDGVRAAASALDAEHAGDSLRAWVAAISALEASAAEAARIASERAPAPDSNVGDGEPISQTPGWTLNPPPIPWTQPTPWVPPPPPPPRPDTWPFHWNEHYRPYDECEGLGHVKTFPADNLSGGLDSGMSTPWTFAWGGDGIAVYHCVVY